MTANYAVVRDAINQRQQITAYYEGFYREMCPHVLGLNAEGEEQGLFYQFGGTSKHGLSPDGSPNNWRCMPLAGLTNVTSRVGSWHTANTPWYTAKVSGKKSPICVERVKFKV
jgi:hypothetical protein